MRDGTRVGAHKQRFLVEDPSKSPRSLVCSAADRLASARVTSGASLLIAGDRKGSAGSAVTDSDVAAEPRLPSKRRPSSERHAAPSHLPDSHTPAAPATTPRRRLELLVAILATGLLVATLAVAVAPQLAFAIVDRDLDLVINTVATLAAGGVSALAWARYREQGDVSSLYQAAAFLVLGTVNVIILGVVLLGLEEPFGLGLHAPGQLPLYALVGARFIAALLLVLGATAAATRFRWQGQGGWLLLTVPAVLFVLLLGVVTALREHLPNLGDPVLLADLDTRSAAVPQFFGPNLLIAQVVVGFLYLAAAYRYLRLYRRRGGVQNGYLATGLVVAAFSQLHFALHPGAYASLVTTGDLLRVAFYGILLVGMDAERHADLRALTSANDQLRLLRDAELARATLEERSRLAREVHDGLAQDLWYAKLKQGRLAQLANLPAEGRQLAGEVASAVDSALAEARQAVMALGTRIETGALAEVLKRYVEEFGDRFGVGVEFSADGELESLSPRAPAELLRIVQEAMNNVRRHADATVIRVHASSTAGRVTIEVRDNGVGFDPAAAVGGYGLRSMRDRAASVGGTLAIESRPRSGARVIVEVPTTHASATSS